ncbi:ATP-binding protein [Bradyrhizobium sp. LHD-71]|uniref:ATP-binding protein n=1 Tax=Bradyrhizobium sp. LHD-71 TaxID=3072141 RepID=UPI00281059C1|nr:ATP-binding protein [Bradyrhizobium sp. LHD-71]MDQ8732334.1 ATP-binding protein [Bradyrhizobium sp. LHD-71]
MSDLGDNGFFEKIATAVKCLPEAVVIWDEHDRLLFWNEKYCELCPVVADMMKPGVYFPDIVWESIQRKQFIFQESPGEWFSRRLEFHHRCEGYMEQQLATGQWVRMSERRTPWGGVISMRSDLTPLKEHEIELRAAKDQAEAATAAKSHFLALISHELRTPMNGVLGLAQTLMRSSLTGRQHSFVATIISSARALAKLLDDMLDVSCIERGQLRIETRSVALHSALDEIVHLFEALAKQKDLVLRARIDENLPTNVLADPLRLRQILINLVNNAVKFTPAGFVEIRTEAATSGRLRISVADSGPGVEERDRAALFHPFSRIRSTALKNMEGAGLGLAICKQLAEAMGGSIAMRGAPGGGSIFTLELAAAKEEAAVVQSARPGAAGHVTLKVLVVDDDPVNILVAQALLDQLGHRTTVRQDGVSALALLDHEAYDVILLDIAMPGEDGVSIAKKIRARGGDCGRIPILAMTAKVMTESVESYKAAGMNGVVPKPIIIDQLEFALAEIGAAQLPDKVARMRSDIGAERCSRILQESCRVIVEAQGEAGRYHGGGSGKTLAAVLHRLAPTAEMLGFSRLSSEALAVETRLNQAEENVDLESLSDLLAQSNDQIGRWIDQDAMGPSAHFEALMPPGQTAEKTSLRMRH